MPKHSADIRVTREGTIWTFTPLNEDARRFFREHLQTEPWQWLGESLCVDHRPAMELHQHLIDEGFSLV